MPEAENILTFNKKDNVTYIVITNYYNRINGAFDPIVKIISGEPLEIKLIANGYDFKQIPKDKPMITLDDTKILYRCIEVKLIPTDHGFEYTSLVFSNKEGLWQYNFLPDAKIILQNDTLYVLNPPNGWHMEQNE